MCKETCSDALLSSFGTRRQCPYACKFNIMMMLMMTGKRPWGEANSLKRQPHDNVISQDYFTDFSTKYVSIFMIYSRDLILACSAKAKRMWNDKVLIQFYTGWPSLEYSLHPEVEMIAHYSGDKVEKKLKGNTLKRVAEENKRSYVHCTYGTAKATPVKFEHVRVDNARTQPMLQVCRDPS